MCLYRIGGPVHADHKSRSTHTDNTFAGIAITQPASSNLFSDYATVWGPYDEITSDFSDSERAKLFHDNAEKYYRI